MWGISHPIRRGDVTRDMVQDATLVCRGFDEDSRVKSRARHIRVLHSEIISRKVDFVVPRHSGFGEGKFQAEERLGVEEQVELLREIAMD